jgi:uncharacterized protein (TIGR02285 family)
MYRNKQGLISGSSAEPVLQAFAKAGISYALREASPARRLMEIRANKGRVCSLGLYRTAERERFARFSKPVSRDSVMVGVASTSFISSPGIAVNEALADPGMTVLIKNSIVYGPYLEKKFATMKAQRVPTDAEYRQLIKLVQLGRSQLTFLPLEEVLYYARQEKLEEKDLNIIRFKGMPAGQKRYLVCSFAVEEETMTRLNRFIRN